MVHFHMALLQITHFISTCGFFSGEWNFVTPKYQQYLVNGTFQFTFWILIPWSSPMHSSTLHTNHFLLMLTLIILDNGPVVSWNIALIYDHNIPNFEVPSFAFPFLGFLQRLQVLLLPARPKLISNVLDTSPMFSTIYIKLAKLSWWGWNYLWFHGQDVHRWQGL